MYQKVRLFNLFLFLFFLLSLNLAWAEEEPNWDTLIPIIIQIESKGNSDAYNKKSQAIGLMQITPIVFMEWREDYEKRHANELISSSLLKIYDEFALTLNSLYDPYINQAIGAWYLRRIWFHYLPHYKLPQNITYLCYVYNWGIGNIVKWYKEGADFDKLPKETRNYIKKYNQLSKLK